MEPPSGFYELRTPGLVNPVLSDVSVKIAIIKLPPLELKLKSSFWIKIKLFDWFTFTCQGISVAEEIGSSGSFINLRPSHEYYFTLSLCDLLVLYLFCKAKVFGRAMEVQLMKKVNHANNTAQ